MQPTLPLARSSATSSRTDTLPTVYAAAQPPQVRLRPDSPRSHLHTAARDGDANTVKRLLAGGNLDP